MKLAIDAGGPPILMPILSLQDVSKDYLTDGQPVHALSGLSLNVERGEFVALVGRSGCGKSTLLNLAGAMDFPTSGKVLLDGVSTSSLKDGGLTLLRREKVTVAMQLERGTHAVLKGDSTAAIRSEGLLGDKYVEISFGSPDAANLKNGDTIASVPPLEISSLIAKTDKILDTAHFAVENANSVAANLNVIISSSHSRKANW